MDESKAMKDLNSRIGQLTKLILTSATVDESKDGEGESLSGSPSKIDFDLSPYQVRHLFAENMFKE
jgi:centromeric protein E